MKVAVSGSQDNNVCCWDMRSRSNEPIQILSDARDCVMSIKVTDHEILTGSIDCHVRRYDLRNGKLMTDFLGGCYRFILLISLLFKALFKTGLLFIVRIC